MIGYVQNVDPVIFRIGAVPVYYYGATYALSFLGIFVWLRHRRHALGWSRSDVYDFCILLALGFLVCGRLYAVLVNHWSDVRPGPLTMRDFLCGGIASRGVLLGIILAGGVFAAWRGRRFFVGMDELALPIAVLLAVGRLGVFAVARLADPSSDGVAPGLEGLAHPVTLGEVVKDLLLIPILLVVRRRWRTGSGILTGHFILWYGLLRTLTTTSIRHYGAELLGREQRFNIAIALVGLMLLVGLKWWRRPVDAVGRWKLHLGLGATLPPIAPRPDSRAWLTVRRVAFAAVLVLSVFVSSVWRR